MNLIRKWLNGPDYMQIRVSRKLVTVLVTLLLFYGAFKLGYKQAIKDITAYLMSVQPGPSSQAPVDPHEGEPGLYH